MFASGSSKDKAHAKYNKLMQDDAGMDDLSTVNRKTSDHKSRSRGNSAAAR